MNNKTKKLTLTAIMIGLSVVLSYVKVPSPTGSVALDALPAFTLAGVLGPSYGGLVGFLGHLSTAANSGFAFGFPSHLVIAVIMFFAAFVFGYFYKRNQKLLAIVTGVFINVVVSLAIFVPMYGMGFFYGMAPALTVGAIINVVFGALVIEPVKKATHSK